MKKLAGALTGKNIASGWMYFYIHFVTEVVCFFFVKRLTGSDTFLWTVALAYDFLAFVPQSPIGKLNDRFPSLNLGFIGIIVMVAAGVLFSVSSSLAVPALIVLCVGNCFVHVSGAEVTVRSSEGRLSHSAVFVAGGSFGLITGTLLASTTVPAWAVIAFAFTAIPFTLLADKYKTRYTGELCEKFNYANPGVSVALIIVLSVIVVAVRGFMGYGIPTTWKKTMLQNVMLYFTMGLGKALGGILSDAFGVKKMGFISVAAALPFLLLGDNLMMVSLLGVMLFSMTMSISLSVLVSVLKERPGFAFGFTTIGLFLGTAPIFFTKISSPTANTVVMISLTVFCLICFGIIIRKDGEADGPVSCAEHDCVPAADPAD